MEQGPEKSPAERNTTGDFIRPAPLPIESNQTRGEREYARRVGRKWGERRRKTAARIYQMMALAGSGELRNRFTMNMMGRWIIEDSASAEPSLTVRSRRRVLLMQRWKAFVGQALEVRRRSRSERRR